MKREGLVIGIIFLMIGLSLIPSTAEDIEKTSLPSSRGNWFYVGGSGPNNYTKIQDAIDNASDGDTVFVYDDSSPYYENLIINKSIQLYGNNWKNTIIFGMNNSNAIIVNHDNVTISNFTIRNCGETKFLILIDTHNNVTINNNLLTVGNFFGRGAIRVFHSGIAPMNSGIVIKENIIIDLEYGISVENCYSLIKDNLIENIIIGIATYASSNTISNNTIKNCGDGIQFYSTTGNKIIYNTFFNCSTGIYLSGYDHIIQWNKFTGCRYGIFNYEGRKNEIHFNNFINNNHSAYFLCDFPRIIYFNHWNRNYWDDHQKNSPMRIPGIIRFFAYQPSEWSISWMQFDWFPAQEPFDILGMS